MKYNIEEINEKANYCLNCKTKPCKQKCPLHNNIPEFIQKIKQEKYEEAYDVLSETTIFEPICGRICPHKSQCESGCVRGIKGNSVQIGELETFIGDYILENKKQNLLLKKDNTLSNKDIAIIGSGPAGIACAYYLSKKGAKITMYEKHSKIGGLLRYGIPEFRLQKKLLDEWIEKYILNKNIKIITNKEINNIEELKEKYNMVILAFGANSSKRMNVEGEDLEFVLGGNELLEYKEKMPNFKDKVVAVIGGGNVAIDSARTIKRLGARKVTIIYRRSEEEMPAEIKEIESAKKENIEFLFQTNILKIKDTHEIECIRTELIQEEGERRKTPVNIEGTNYCLSVDYVISAVGAKTNSNLISKLNLNTDNYGYIKIDENYKTSDEKIYAIRRFSSELNRQLLGLHKVAGNVLK